MKTNRLSIQLYIGCTMVALLNLLSFSKARADALDNWTTIQVSTNYFGLDFVAHGNGRYVAYGEYSDWGVIITSENGQTWTVRSDGGYPSGSGLSFPFNLVYTAGRFFALGAFGTSGFSTNGLDWTIFTDPTSMLFGVAGDGLGRFVAVSGYGNLWRSTNGVNWSPRSSGSPSSFLGDIAYGAGLFVAKGVKPDPQYGNVDDSGHIYISGSGFTWTQLNIPGGNHISYCNGMFIVPYGLGTNLLSLDGINWTVKGTGLTSLLNKAYFANGLFMARCGIYLATSADGTNWIQYPQALAGDCCRDPNVATDGSRLVTVHRGGSDNGDPIRYNGYIYLSDVFVGIGITNSAPPQVALSGLVGRSYQIQSTDALTSGTNAWQTNISLQLPATPYVWTDSTATNSQRFYRGVLLP